MQGFTGDGFTGLAIIYSTFALANWAAPAVVEFTGTEYMVYIINCKAHSIHQVTRSVSI